MGYVRRRRLKDGTVRWYARYLGADGRYHEEGGYTSERAALKAANRREVEATTAAWTPAAAGRVTFAEYVERYYWPSTAHLEASTRAPYRYTIDRHFLPRFGKVPMRRITPVMVQAWVNDAARMRLSNRTVVKQHALLRKIFNRAIVDRVVPANPCAHSELPKVVLPPKRIITVEQFEAILTVIPARFRLLVLLAIETGMRWGELVALRPCDVNLATRTVHVRRTIVEIPRRHSPTGERYLVKRYPKDDEQRDIQIDAATCQLVRDHEVSRGVRDIDLLFTTATGRPISRNNFRTKHWKPAVNAANVGHSVTFHNLRAAHASWLLAGGADIVVVQERLGHRQITTTQQYTGTLPDAGERALAAFRKIRYGNPES